MPGLVIRGSPAHLEQGAVAFVLLGEVGLQPFGVHGHGAELPHLERLAVKADPDLLEEDEAAVLDADTDRDGGEDRRQQVSAMIAAALSSDRHQVRTRRLRLAARRQ